MYGSTKNTLNEVHVMILLLHDKPEDSLPTSNAAGFHLRRSFCQAAKLIYAAETSHADLPSPVEGRDFRNEGGHLVPIMMSPDPMPKIVTCNCQGFCNSKTVNVLKGS